jgi:putative hemolysin
MKELPNPTFALSPVAMPRGSLHQSGHAVIPAVVQRPAVGKISVSWARHQDEVREAQRLRYQVFAGEMGARLSTSVPGHDVDLFDDYCEHLLVRDAATQEVMGTYRVLTPVQAKRVGSTYSDTEFDLTRLRACASAWWSWAAAACMPTTARAASSWRCGARWPSSWCATSSTP